MFLNRVVVFAGGEGITFSVFEPATSDFSGEPVLAIQSQLLAQAMLSMYLGTEPLVASAKSTWIETAAQLLKGS